MLRKPEGTNFSFLSTSSSSLYFSFVSNKYTTNTRSPPHSSIFPPLSLLGIFHHSLLFVHIYITFFSNLLYFLLLGGGVGGGGGPDGKERGTTCILPHPTPTHPLLSLSLSIPISLCTFLLLFTLRSSPSSQPLSPTPPHNPPHLYFLIVKSHRCPAYLPTSLPLPLLFPMPMPWSSC